MPLRCAAGASRARIPSICTPCDEKKMWKGREGKQEDVGEGLEIGEGQGGGDEEEGMDPVREVR
jgi:hypothetical protein